MLQAHLDIFRLGSNDLESCQYSRPLKVTIALITRFLNSTLMLTVSPKPPVLSGAISPAENLLAGDLMLKKKVIPGYAVFALFVVLSMKSMLPG